MNYDDEESLENVLKGQQVLIITLSVAANQAESQLFKAAAKAGVPYVVPNWYAQDPDNEALLKDTFLHSKSQKMREEVESLGVSAWIQIVCGFWYEFSLSFGSDTFGFDLEKKHVTWLDNGKTKFTSTTWDQCGRAMASLLSLPELPQDECDYTVTLSQFRSKAVYIQSFELNQRDMFESLKRVTKTNDDDWTFKTEEAYIRQTQGVAEVKAGNMRSFTKALYSRVLSPSDPGNFSFKVHNQLLGLPKEDIDDGTAIAVEMAKSRSSDNYVNDESNKSRQKMVGLGN